MSPSSACRKSAQAMILESHLKSFRKMISASSTPIHERTSSEVTELPVNGLQWRENKCFPCICWTMDEDVLIFSSSFVYCFVQSSRKRGNHNTVALEKFHRCKTPLTLASGNNNCFRNLLVRFQHEIFVNGKISRQLQKTL